MTPLLLSADAASAAGAFLMLLFIGGCLIGMSFYFLPSFIAAARGKGDRTAGILLVNLFFGWAVLGWLGCLIWAIWYLIVQQGDELIVRGRATRMGVRLEGVENLNVSNIEGDAVLAGKAV
jgi:uncharacterized membrane protein YedE/YeeE